MKKSRTRGQPPPIENKPRKGLTQRTPRRGPVNPTNPNSRPRPQGATIAVPDLRPYTTRTSLPHLPKRSYHSAVVGIPNLDRNSGTDDGNATHAEMMLSAAEALWRRKQLHDVVLAVGHHRIGAHRVILAVSSGYFKDRFTMEEEHEREEVRFVYTLHGISYEALKVLLESIYTSHLDVTYDNLYELLNAAIYLKVTVALRTCRDFLLLNLCAETSLKTLSVAHAFELTDIAEQAVQIAAMNFVQVSQIEDFFSISEQPLKKILKRDDLKVESELQVFKAVQSWIETDKENRLNDSAVTIFSLVRLPMIKPSDLVDHVESVECFKQIPGFENLVKEALYYYCLPLRRSILQSPRTSPRSLVRLEAAVCLGGQPQKAKEGVSNEVKYFNPETECWKTLTTMPHPRHHHAATVLGGFLYIAGGRELASATDHPKNTAHRYDPRTDSWIQIADMIHARESFQLGVLKEMIYAIGGRIDDKTSLADVERYDPFKDQWEEVAPLAGPRRCVAVTTHGELIYAMGGSGQGKISSRVECFDAQTNTWKTRKPLQVPRIFGLLSSIKDHIYLAGGATVDNSGTLCCVPNIEKYHPSSDTWSILSAMITPRAEAACTVVEGRIFYVGGYNWDTKSWVQTVETYDVADDSWKEIGNLSKPYTGIACTTLVLYKLP